MAALSSEEAIERALESFPNIDCLRDEQKKCIAALLQKKDVLGLLPTGFGKSLIFQLYPRIFELVNGRKNCHVVIVSALNAITEEQVQELADIGISAVAVGDSRETDENILKGDYKLVFGSAEMWLRKTWINNFKKSAQRFSGNFWILKNMFTCGLLIQLRRLSRNGFFADCLFSWDLTFGFDFVIFFAHVTRGPK